MVVQDDGATAESRPPTLNDLLTLCRELNERRAKYFVIGGREKDALDLLFLRELLSHSRPD